MTELIIETADSVEEIAAEIEFRISELHRRIPLCTSIKEITEISNLITRIRHEGILRISNFNN